MMRLFTLLVWLCLVFAASTVHSAGTLTDNRIISSFALEYDLQYRVYLPEGYETLENLPVIYITDGQWYIGGGDMPAKIDEEILEGRIEPVIAVFIDNRDPHNLRDNRRNYQFFCNKDYVRFFGEELIPEIDGDFKTHADRESRVILGLSFGGLNSACFGVYAYPIFAGIAMQSPALHPVRNLYDMYSQAGKLPIKIFISSGSVNDNTQANRRWHKHLKEIGYDVEYREIRQGHNWKNWRPLLDDVLQTYFSVQN